MEVETIHPAYIFRPLEQGDQNFILSSWGSSFYRAYDGYNYVVPAEAFHEHHRPIREAFFKHPESTAVIAASKENPELILGYVLYERTPRAFLVHYVYVKEAFKGLGIAQELLGKLPAETVLYTHLTDKAKKIIRKKPELFKNYKYVPHLMKWGVE